MIIKHPTLNPAKSSELSSKIMDLRIKYDLNLEDSIWLYQKAGFEVDIVGEIPENHRPSLIASKALKELFPDLSSETSTNFTWMDVMAEITDPDRIVVIMGDEKRKAASHAGYTVIINGSLTTDTVEAESVILIGGQLISKAVNVTNFASYHGDVQIGALRASNIIIDEYAVMTGDSINKCLLEGKPIPADIEGANISAQFNALMGVAISSLGAEFLPSIAAVKQNTKVSRTLITSLFNTNMSEVATNVNAASFADIDEVNPNGFGKAIGLARDGFKNSDMRTNAWIAVQLKAVKDLVVKANNEPFFLQAISKNIGTNVPTIQELDNWINKAESLSAPVNTAVKVLSTNDNEIFEIEKYMNDNKGRFVNNSTLPTHNKAVGSGKWIGAVLSVYDNSLKIIVSKDVLSKMLKDNSALRLAVLDYIKKEVNFLKK